MGAKFAAYAWTGSTGILSDALESIVNVASAVFLVGTLFVAGIPADRNHPYGHGKIEFIAAAFEGGLLTFAALGSLLAAARALWEGPRVEEVDRGLWVVAVAGLGNLGLGAYLVRIGRRHRSMALESDGFHVLSDTATTVFLLASLALVKWTGIPWFDPACAVVLGVLLGGAGYRLVRQAIGGLLDEADPAVLRAVLTTMESGRLPGLIRIHHLRALRFGARAHVDAHLVMPAFWSLEEAHALLDAGEKRLQGVLGADADVMFHGDPCRRLYCEECDLDPCPIRAVPFRERIPWTAEDAVRTDGELHAARSLPGATVP